MIATAGGSFQGNLSSGKGGYLSRGGEGTRAMEGEPVRVLGTGKRPLEARYARMRGEGARIAGPRGRGVEGACGRNVAQAEADVGCREPSPPCYPS